MAKRKSAARSGSYPAAILGLVLTVAVLYFAKPVIVPLALAVLITFILAPLVAAVQRRGVPRVPATLCVVLLAFVLAGLIGWGVGAQVSKLASDLPKHTKEIRAKINRLRTSRGPISKLSKMFTDVGQAPGVATSQPVVLLHPKPRAAVVAEAPMDSSTALQQLTGVAGVIFEPVATAALVLVLVIFMLIRREDLRNRVVGLLGPARLTGTTRVTVEAGRRLSKFLLAQLCVNASFGLLVGLGLLVIGVPYWFLWGFMAAVLRFIPYVGTWVAALLPITLSFAISPGWTKPIEVFAFYFCLDLVTANVVEPLLFGHSTGVSPVALIIAAAFWTWIWGPIGLMLSTPLTVCLVVLGHNAPRLRALAMLLGDQPALEPHMNYYQRLLAGDEREAAQVLTTHANDNADASFDEMMIPALWRMRRDRARGDLETDDERFFLDTTASLLTTREVPFVANAAAPLVLACPAHHRAEESVVRMLRLAMQSLPLRFESVSTQMLAVDIERQVETQHPAVVVIAVLPPGGLVQARYLCRRLRARFDDLKIIVAYFGRPRDFDRLLVRLRKSGASYVTTSVLQTRSQIAALIDVPSEPPVPVAAQLQEGI